MAIKLELRHAAETLADEGETDIVGELVEEEHRFLFLRYSTVGTSEIHPRGIDSGSSRELSCQSKVDSELLLHVCSVHLLNGLYVYADQKGRHARTRRGCRRFSRGILEWSVKNASQPEDEGDDICILLVFVGCGGRRHRRMYYCALFCEEVHFDDWPLEGGRDLTHAVGGITWAGRTWLTHHDNWKSLSRVPEGSRSSHEHLSRCAATLRRVLWRLEVLVPRCRARLPTVLGFCLKLFTTLHASVANSLLELELSSGSLTRPCLQ